MKKIWGIAVSVAFVSGSAYGSEGGRATGTSAFAIDGQSYFALPPPGGVWFINYTGRQQADRILDNHGRDTIRGAEVTADVNVFRISWFPKVSLWGAEWAAFEIFPTYVRTSFEYQGRKSSVSDWADLAIDPFGLAWRLDDGIVGFSTTFILPTASYDQNRPVNTGRNFASWTPQFFYTRFLEDQAGDVSLHLGYEYNFSNDKGVVSAVNPAGAEYKSGQVFHAEVAYSRYLTQRWSLAGSLVGSYQFTDDEIRGDRVANGVLQGALEGNRYKALGAGISTRYMVAGVVPVFLSYTKDVYARSKTKGDQLMLRLIVPLMRP